MPDPSSQPPPSPWVILGSIPRVCAADADIPPGNDLSLALAPPPRVSLLSIQPRLFPDVVTSRNRPTVLAADPSGLLVLHANQGRATGPFRIERPGFEQAGWSEFNTGCFVLDAASASALALPDPELITDEGHVGLILAPGGGSHYIVAELQPVLRREKAVLLCFSSDVGEWVMKDVLNPVPPRPWWPAVVLSYYGRLWWVDLSFGLITCDPSVDAPVLAFVPLPPGKMLRYREAAGVLDRYRNVRVSAGKLRFVDMDRNRDGRCALKVSVWTLLDPEAGFPDIWADESYKDAGLPRKIPLLALIHPHGPRHRLLLRFFLDEHLFGVDLRACKVVECEVYELVMQPGDVVSTRFVHVWELPRALSSGLKDRTEENLSATFLPSDLKNKK